MRRELRLALAEWVFPLTLLIIGALTLLALWAGSLRTKHRLEFQESLKRNNQLQRQFLDSAFAEGDLTESNENELTPAQIDRRYELQFSAKLPDLMRYTGGIWWTIYPASKLSHLSMGSSGDWPDHYHHGGSSLTKTLNRSVRSNPLLATVGAFDLTLLVGAMLPLAVIVLTYHIAASDREQGRWPLLGLHSASIPRLILIRCIVRVGALAFTVFTVTVAWILLFPEHQGELAAWNNFLVWSAWLALYLLFWAALSVFANSLPLSTAGSGLLLLLCWGVLVIAVPSAVQTKINQAYQIPPQAEFLDVEDEIQQQTEQESEQIWNEFLKENRDIELDKDNPQQEYLLRDIALNRKVRSRVRERVEQFYHQFLEREAALDRAQLLSPLLAWRTVAEQSAAVSLRHYLDFARQTAQYHETYIRYFEPFSIAGEELTQSDIQNIPQFDSQESHLRLHLLPLLISAGSLLFWITVVGVCSWWNLRRLAIQ